MPVSVNSHPTESVADPFDLDALRVTNLEDITIEKVLLTVPVRRPRKTEFIRVHPDSNYAIDTSVIEREEGMDKETYLIAPGLREELATDLRVVRIFTCVTKRGGLFLWPIKLPQTDGSGQGRRWAETALEIAEVGKRSWVKLVASRELGGYEMFRARGDLGEPAWPAKPFKELVELAFNGHLIDRADHDVIRELTGEI